MGFQKMHLKFHRIYLTHALKDMIFSNNVDILRALSFKSLYLFLKCFLGPGTAWFSNHVSWQLLMQQLHINPGVLCLTFKIPQSN